MNDKEVKTFLKNLTGFYPQVKVSSTILSLWLSVLSDDDIRDADALLEAWHSKGNRKEPTPEYFRDHVECYRLEREAVEAFKRHTDTLSNTPTGNDGLSRLIRKLTTGSEEEVKAESKEVKPDRDFEVKFPNELQAHFLATHEGFYWDSEEGIIKDRLRNYSKEPNAEQKQFLVTHKGFAWDSREGRIYELERKRQTV